MKQISKFSVLRFLNYAGTPSAPSYLSQYGYLIPLPRTFMRIDPSQFLNENLDISLDLKSLSSYSQSGIDIIKTKYYLKKDFYVFALSKSMNKLIMCNVNERSITSSNNGASLFCPDIERTEEDNSETKFSITCCGASVSMN
jgi:hypothetical protein